MIRLLLDTNIVLDYAAKREPFYIPARKLFMLGHMGDAELWTGLNQIVDAFYILTSTMKIKSREEAKAQIKQLRTCMKVCAVGELELDDALDSEWSDLEDALVYQAARRIHADAIVTRDAQGFARSRIKVFDCDGLFDYLAREKGLDYRNIPC